MNPVPEIKNIFSTTGASFNPDSEHVDLLLNRDDVIIERIVSRGHVTPSDSWYEQETDEWVVLLKGKASIELSDGMLLHLTAGDYFMLPAGMKHRVSYTSKEPPCIWLALHTKPV